MSDKVSEQEQLIPKLTDEIIDHLNLEDLSKDDVGPDDELFGEAWGLDSIDALELIVLLEQNYGIKIDNAKEGKEIFQTVRTLANYIIEHQK